jgi:hypothetical protein
MILLAIFVLVYLHYKVCGNAIAGQWMIPEVFNDSTGQKCR